MNIRSTLANLLFSDLITQRVTNAVKVIDDKWWDTVASRRLPSERNWYEIEGTLKDALAAWRTNPLARQIVRTTTSYILGHGITPTSTLPDVAAFIRRFWLDPLNNFPIRLPQLSDSLTLEGELFIVLYTNPGDGISYVRTRPARLIDNIVTDPNDYETPLQFHEIGTEGNLEGRWWQPPHNWDLQSPAMMHFAINRPIGAVRGESSLAPYLVWLRRYSAWLEDRVRLNRYRTAFLWDVTVAGSEAEIRQAQSQYATPPTPGTVMVHGESEEWQAKSFHIDASDARPDGYAIRMMIAAGAGMPLHWLGEPEGSTRTTAQESSLPAIQNLTQRQMHFRHVIMSLLATACERAAYAGFLPYYGDWQITVDMPDLTRADNRTLADSAHIMAQTLEILRSHDWIDDNQARDLAFRFAGEEPPDAIP